MKRILFISLITLVLVSCSKDDENELIISNQESMILNININKDTLRNNVEVILNTQSSGDLNEVVYYLDGKSIGSSITSPFSFSFTPKDIVPGVHLLECVGKSKFNNSFKTSRSIFMKAYLGDAFKGGKIFYIDSTNIHGLISSTIDVECDGYNTFEWGRDTLLSCNDNDGAVNTRIMSLTISGNLYAASVFKNGYLYNGYDDWYIPSISELTLLKQNKNYVGGFSSTTSLSTYWSSTEINKSTSYCLNMVALIGNAVSKTSFRYRVRAIRKF